MSFHDDVINVHLQVAADLLLETLLHTSLESSLGVAEDERHGCVAEGAKRGDERCGQLVQGVHGNLLVPGIRV
jgi:hypothetical protein